MLINNFIQQILSNNIIRLMLFNDTVQSYLCSCCSGISIWNGDEWNQTCRAESRVVPSQWETLLQSNAVCHWLHTNLESALNMTYNSYNTSTKHHRTPFPTQPNEASLLWLTGGRDQSEYAPSQWETSLHCNDGSHGLGAYLDWSLRRWQPFVITALLKIESSCLRQR